jgi:hypothetical protein
VGEVTVDIEQASAIRLLVDHVVIPDHVMESAGPSGQGAA